MRLVLNDWGCFLGRQGDRFVVRRREGAPEEFSADQVDQVLILASSSVSSEAVMLAADRAIDIVYLDWRGHPVARVFPGKLGGTTLIRRRQVEASMEDSSSHVVRQLVFGKIANQGYFLKSLAKTRGNAALKASGAELLGVAQSVLTQQGKLDKIRQPLLGIEGSAALKYFSALARILPFSGRDRQGSDAVNACLNYGYGILYSEVEKALLLSGLDPYFGYFHTDRYGKRSLVFDFIEPFRPVLVDRAVVTLFVQKQVSDEDLEVRPNEIGSVQRLKASGRQKVARAVLERFATKIKLEEEMALSDALLRQARQLAAFLLDARKPFEAFLYKW
jgi:CRISPR-associated protein Cas1